jgi:uncharacterized protein (TIGR03032 family)
MAMLLTESEEKSSNSFLPINASEGLWEWLEKEQISVGFTTYQTNRLMLVGRKANGRLAINERLFDKPMGLYAQGNSLYMSTRYQIWQLDNHLAKGETYQEADRLYVPSLSYTTGSLNVHDLVLGRDGTPIFINTDFSCLATIQAGYSFAPIWQPPFITKLVAEDRCHLNGLAMVEGEPAYVTACSMTDSAAGWRSHRNDGGIVVHIPSNEVVLRGLSMPHSPRWYQGKLWILNAGTGELGYVDDHQFIPIAFCPGFVRGLAFWGDLAIVGLSKLRSASFSGLVLEERLLAEGNTAQCGLIAINIHSGEIVHSLFLDKPIEELFDVVVLPNVCRPMSLGFQDEDIERLVTFPSSNGLVTTKPTVKRPRDSTLMIAGFPTKERIERENQESREYEAMERQEQLAEAKVKFQRVFHLNPESLAPYDGMTFPSLQQRWQNQPQRGEVIGVSASVLGDMVGFAIAELLPNLKAEIISLFVDPNHRQKGVGTKMLAFLEREIGSQKVEQIALVYAPTPLADRALTSMFRKLGWAAPRSLDNGFKVALKGLPTVNPAISGSAKVKFEEGKNQVKDHNLEQAVICFQEAIALQPDYVGAYNQLGNALQGLGESEQEIACYQKILEINPNVAAAHCNLGSIWQTQEKFEAAIAAYQRAIALKPDFVLAHQNLGGLLASQRRFVEAESCLIQALQLQPQTPELHQQLGNILRQIGKIEEAMTCFRNAIKLNPQFGEAFHNLGCLLMTKGQIEAAQKCFEKVLKLQPDSPTIHPNLGFILEAQGKYPEALIAYDRALALNPEATELLYQREHLRLILCDWDDFDVRMQTLTERIQEHIRDPRSARLSPLSLSCFPVPRQLHQAVNRHWSQHIIESMADLKARCGFEHQHNQEHNRQEKIRLGYLSADFRSHAVGCLIADIFQYHDRHVFEVYAYSLTDTEDEITEIIRDGCDVFVNIAHLSVEAAARRIYEDRIDILIDLGGYTTSSRPEILALQPAPIQMQYLGYPDTMAAEFMQYILSDRWIIPTALAHHYTEQVLELPQTFIASPVAISEKALTRQELGLPEQGFVYCCFNRTDKFDPHLFAIWMRILQKVPESVLWLIEVTPAISATLRKEGLAKGVDPRRLVFSPRFSMSEFIAIAQRADLFLDTFNYNAGATAICGLQSGLPILTCTGETFTSRMAASICASVGLEALICDSPLVYEQQAIYWGKHPQELGLIRTKLLESKQNLPLFQPKQWVGNLESILKNLSQ